jgi:hypothetical protein
VSGKFNFEIEQQRFDERRLSAEPKLELVGWVSDKAVRLLALGANVHADIYTCEAPGCVPLYAAPPEPAAKPEPVAVDLAKEGSDKTVISFVTLPSPAKPEPATDATDNRRVWDAYIKACREFERFHGIPPLCAAIDAAMDAPATPAAAAGDASTAPAMQCAYPHCCDKAGNRCPRMFAGLCSGPRAADPQQVPR